MFQLNRLSFSLPERALLHDINLQFSPNRAYGLIGHNGSGKSTLLKLLTRQIQPTAGSLLLDNRPAAA
ncbi:ATP-binding cassette domain-containing protein, partial [Neisseria dentiae]